MNLQLVTLNHMSATEKSLSCWASVYRVWDCPSVEVRGNDGTLKIPILDGSCGPDAANKPIDGTKPFHRFRNLYDYGDDARVGPSIDMIRGQASRAMPMIRVLKKRWSI